MLVDIAVKKIPEYEGDPFGDPDSDREWLIRRGHGIYESYMLENYIGLLAQEKGLGRLRWTDTVPYDPLCRGLMDKARDRERAPDEPYWLPGEREEFMRLIRLSSSEYGIADNLKQVLRKHRNIWYDPRPFVLGFYQMYKPEGYEGCRNPYGPWYGRKDGEYIGNFKSEDDMTVAFKWHLHLVPEELVIR